MNEPLPRPKQEKFCQSVASGMNLSEAYRVSYPGTTMSSKAINEKASLLMSNVKIKQRVAELMKPAIVKAKVTAERVIEELARIAFVDNKMLYNDDGTLKPIHTLDSEVTRAISSIKSRIEKQGQDKDDWAEVKEVKMHDKIKALELLGKTLALFTDKLNIEATITLKDFVEARRKNG